MLFSWSREQCSAKRKKGFISLPGDAWLFLRFSSFGAVAFWPEVPRQSFLGRVRAWDRARVRVGFGVLVRAMVWLGVRP